MEDVGYSIVCVQILEERRKEIGEDQGRKWLAGLMVIPTAMLADLVKKKKLGVDRKDVGVRGKERKKREGWV